MRLGALAALALFALACDDPGSSAPRDLAAPATGDLSCLFFPCPDPRCPPSAPQDPAGCSDVGLRCVYYEQTFVCGCDHRLACETGVCCGTVTSVCALPDLGSCD